MAVNTTGSSVYIQVPGGPVAVTANSSTPSNPLVLIALDNNGNFNIPGGINQNQVPGATGLGGTLVQRVEFLSSRTTVGGGVTAALALNTSTTNSFAYTHTDGSIGMLQSFQTATTAGTSLSLVNRVTTSGAYVGNGANLTLGVVAQNTGGGSVSTCNINALAYPNLGTTLGALMTNGTSQAVSSTSATTYTWVMTGGGTGAPVLTPGVTPIELAIQFNQVNVSGTNGVNILDWFIK